MKTAATSTLQATFYIEGDNLDALKLLQTSYLGKVKLIYIDPPYNTGNDFIYRDDFTQDADDFDKAAQVTDAEGNRLIANRESRGRFHSDWCAMIYARLLIAKNFLAPDGVIFISIDDHEQANLKKICDEVFGEKNFVGLFFRKTKSGGGSASGTCAVEHDYILVFTKDLGCIKPLTQRFNENYLKRYSERDEHGVYFWDTMQRSSTKTRPYKIIAPDGTELSGKWFRSEETCKRDLAAGEVRFLKKADGWSVQFKQRLADGKKLRTILDEEDLTDNRYRSLSEELTKIVGVSFGHPPKPLVLMETLINSVCKNDFDSIVMDFFSGSATTAQAVMELNAQDGGKRKFIMIQIDEPTPDNSEARRAGFLTICDIGKERIHRAGDKIQAEYPELDTGFRVFKVDSSNFLPPMPSLIENIKPDRDAWDLLFGTLLKCGQSIQLGVKEETIDGYRVLNYGSDILACFECNVPAAVFKQLAERKPRFIFLRDSCFASSADKLNALECFKCFAPNTTVKIL